MSTGQTISDVCVRERKRERVPICSKKRKRILYASLHQILFWESEQYHNNEA